MHSHLWWLRGEGEKGRFTYLVGAKGDLAALTFHKLIILKQEHGKFTLHHRCYTAYSLGHWVCGISGWRDHSHPDRDRHHCCVI